MDSREERERLGARGSDGQFDRARQEILTGQRFPRQGYDSASSGGRCPNASADTEALDRPYTKYIKTTSQTCLKVSDR